MGEAELDTDDEAEAAETGEAPKKAGRKMYKGEVLTVKEVADKMEHLGVMPIQPVKRKYEVHGFAQSLPPSFVVTKFVPGFGGNYSMHYYHPSAKQKAYRDVPGNLELNLLSGIRAGELQKEWTTAMETNFGNLCRRITCTIGTDPEVFAVDGNGGVIPAWNFLKGKDDPGGYKTGDGSFNATYYWDGFQAEFTTPGQISCLAQMTDCVQAGLKAVFKAARKVNPKATLSIKSVLPVTDKHLSTAAPEHVAFGCAPSKNVYGLAGNGADGRTVPYRFAGGHIHMGLNGYSQAKIERIVRSMDQVLGVACVSMFAKFDNPLRRQYYGQPGEHRLPPHGLEYRALSNAWLSHPLMLHMVFDLARAAAGLVEENMDTQWKATEAETIETVMNHDVPQARAILTRNLAFFKGILQTIGGVYLTNKDATELAAKIWLNGMETALTSPENIVGNWHLDGHWVSHSEGANAYFARAITPLLRGSTV